MDRQDSERITIEVLLDHSGAAPGAIERGTPLGADGLDLDSFAILEVVLEIEAKTGVEIRQGNLDGAALRTVGGLLDFVADLSR